MSSDNGGDRLPRRHGVIGIKAREGKRDFGENNTANNTKQIAVATYCIYHMDNWRSCRTNGLLQFSIDRDILFLRIMKACYLLKLHCRSLQIAIKYIGGEKEIYRFFLIKPSLDLSAYRVFAISSG